MSKVTRMPNRSPKVTSRITRGSATPKPPKAANTNMSRTAREAAIRAKYPVEKGTINSGKYAYPKPSLTEKGWTINSGKYAYGPKPPSTALKINKAVKGIAKGIAAGAGGVARGAMRAAGPAGALASMTTPAGTGSDKPRGPLMSGNKSRGPGGGSLSAPARTQPSRSGGASNSKGPAGPSGPNSSPSRSTGTSKGPAGPLGPNSSPSRSTGTSKGPGGPLGPNSSPSRSGARTSFGGPR